MKMEELCSDISPAMAISQKRCPLQAETCVVDAIVLSHCRAEFLRLGRRKGAVSEERREACGRGELIAVSVIRVVSFSFPHCHRGSRDVLTPRGSYFWRGAMQPSSQSHLAVENCTLQSNTLHIMPRWAPPVGLSPHLAACLCCVALAER